ILNRRGYVVASLVAPAGQTVSLTTYLAQGTYTVRFEGLTADRGEALPKLTYSLKGVTLTDPIGPTGSDPTLGGKGTVTNDYVWTKFLLDYYTNLVLDPITDVLR